MSASSPSLRRSFAYNGAHGPHVAAALLAPGPFQQMLLGQQPPGIGRKLGEQPVLHRLQRTTGERLRVVVHRQDPHSFPRFRHRSPGGGSGETRKADGRAVDEDGGRIAEDTVPGS